MATTEEDRQSLTTALRLPGHLHRDLKRISEQSGIQLAQLMRLAAERLVDEVKKTGRVPVPAVQIGTNDEETE